jgi:hypothetical protein
MVVCKGPANGNCGEDQGNNCATSHIRSDLDRRLCIPHSHLSFNLTPMTDSAHLESAGLELIRDCLGGVPASLNNGHFLRLEALTFLNTTKHSFSMHTSEAGVSNHWISVIQLLITD